MNRFKNFVSWAVILAMFLFGLTMLILIVARAQVTTCDQSLWNHIYHKDRLHVLASCVSLTGTWQDASRGTTADGCRHEKDGDGHCWLKLDEGEESYLNAENISKQNSNIVVEPICVYRTTQEDAKTACANWHQEVAFPKIGARVRVTGAFVLDAQHGHNELHPVTKIEVLTP